METRTFQQFMKALTYLKNKTASFLVALIRFLTWSEKHRKIILPATIIILILLGSALVSLTSKMSREHTISNIYNSIKGKCSSCNQEMPVIQNPNDLIKPPAKIPDYFYKQAEKNSGSEKQETGTKQ